MIHFIYNYIDRYSVEELKYYPLNTVLYDPPKKMEPGSKEARQAAENQVKEVIISESNR